MEILGTVAIVGLVIIGGLIALAMLISFLTFVVEEGNGGCTEARQVSSGNTFSVQIPDNGQCRGYVEYCSHGSLPDYIQQAYMDPAYQIEHKKR